MSSIFPIVRTCRFAQLGAGHLIALEWDGWKGYAITTPLLDPMDGFGAMLLGPFTQNMSHNYTTPDQVSVLDFGIEWAATFSPELEGVHFPRSEDEMRPGSLLITNGGELAIASRGYSGSRAFYQVKEKRLAQRARDVYGALTKWSIEVRSGERCCQILSVEALSTSLGQKL